MAINISKGNSPLSRHNRCVVKPRGKKKNYVNRQIVYLNFACEETP